MGSRRYYSRGWPAICRDCRGLAYDRPHGIVTALWFIVAWLGIPFPSSGKLRPISPEGSRRSRQLTYVSLLVTTAMLAILFIASLRRH